MLSARASTHGLKTTTRSSANALKSFNGFQSHTAFRPTLVVIYQQPGSSPRAFSTTPSRKLKDFFPEVETKSVRKTPAAWPHPVYSMEQLNAVTVAHREVRDWRDRIALAAIRVLRWGLDLASGYKHDNANAINKTNPTTAAEKYSMTEKKWMIRYIFLESVAGVPGMVAGVMRHLHSMRRMKRDNGWIETLLEESYNERMHLLSFLKMAQPGFFMRLMVLGAQGVFFNGFFIAYLISPRICHRFVGYLEEEAVITYTRTLKDIDAGKLPKWEKLQAPDIAIDYWKMPEGHRTMRDLILYIRADEAKHREVNHTFGNLDQKHDPNPYVSEYKDPSKPHPTKGIEYLQPTGWERKDII